MFAPLDEERIAAVWKTHFGYLLLTNLRVVSLWHRPRILGALGLDPDEWHEGPSFFLYALEPPHPTGRFVQLESGTEGDPESGRFEVQDPGSVATRIAEEIPRGRVLWEARRARVQDRMRSLQVGPVSPVPGPVREIIREVVRVPCRYCGCLMDEAAARCPNCGAAPH